MEFINIMIFSSYKGVASSEFLGLHHTFQRLRLRHKFTLDKALRTSAYEANKVGEWLQQGSKLLPFKPTNIRTMFMFKLLVF